MDERTEDRSQRPVGDSPGRQEAEAEKPAPQEPSGKPPETPGAEQPPDESSREPIGESPADEEALPNPLEQEVEYEIVEPPEEEEGDDGFASILPGPTEEIRFEEAGARKTGRRGRYRGPREPVQEMPPPRRAAWWWIVAAAVAVILLVALILLLAARRGKAAHGSSWSWSRAGSVASERKESSRVL